MGKFGEFGKLSAIRQIKLVLTINNLLADLLIRHTFFHQMLETSQFTKLSPRQTFPLYGSQLVAVYYVFNLLYTVAILMCSVNISLPVCSLTY